LADILLVKWTGRVVDEIQISHKDGKSGWPYSGETTAAEHKQMRGFFGLDRLSRTVQAEEMEEWAEDRRNYNGID
jgi:hypothetical protein